MDIAILERRGSPVAGERRREVARAKKQKAVKQTYPPVPILSAEEIWRGIPNYNPCIDAVGYDFDYDKAVKAIEFFHEKLKHVKGEKAGQPFFLESWEQSIIGNLFGWYNKETGLRRYRECFIEVARKQGKTPLAAGIILYILFEDKEPGAEIYGAAAEYKQASLVFTHAWGMVNQCEELKDRVQIFKGQAKAMEIGEPGAADYGVYRVISSDALVAQGFNTSAAVIDELHTQPNSELVEAIQTSTGARRQPLIVYITTKDYDKPSICNEKEEYAVNICDGTIKDASFLPVVYALPDDADWTDERIWRLANPNLGVSVKLDYLQRECKRAKEQTSYENTFKRLHLNMKTQQDIRWLKLEQWDKCVGIVVKEALFGRECFGALDLSATQDISAFDLFFPEDKKVLPFFWVPLERARERQNKDHVPYLQWIDEGLIRATPGNVVDYDIIRRDINGLNELYSFNKIAIDRWNATQISTQLTGDGFEVIGFGQGFASMSAPAKELERLVASCLLQHGGNPVLRWMAGNVAIEMDAAGNIKPSKKLSTERIDGIVSLTMSIGLAGTEPTTKRSVYEDRGVLTI